MHLIPACPSNLGNPSEEVPDGHDLNSPGPCSKQRHNQIQSLREQGFVPQPVSLRGSGCLGADKSVCIALPGSFHPPNLYNGSWEHNVFQPTSCRSQHCTSAELMLSQSAIKYDPPRSVAFDLEVPRNDLSLCAALLHFHLLDDRHFAESQKHSCSVSRGHC